MNGVATSFDPDHLISKLGVAAKAASSVLSQVNEADVNALLSLIADKLRGSQDVLLAANEQDIAQAKARGLTEAMIDRLLLTPERIEGMAAGVEVVRDLPDPLGRVLWEAERPNGLNIQRVSVPIGVLGMIYESRPNVTIDAAALCLKSRNAVVLRGGSESLHSSLALQGLVQDALRESGLPEACVSMVPVTDRVVVGAMLAAHETIDVMIPRGGKGLTSRVMEEARMPVFAHLDGLCHIYVHPSVKPEIACEVVLNAKMRRTGICGAVETVLFDKTLDPAIAQDVIEALLAVDCTIVGDDTVCGMHDAVTPAVDEDWVTEYLDAKVSIKVVDGVQAAVEHINTYGSHHTDSILAEDVEAVAAFLNQVDSGICMHNASTQFADGGEFGMGAEIGIATGKMHARGPVGLEQLCTYKYHVRGNGQTRA